MPEQQVRRGLPRPGQPADEATVPAAPPVERRRAGLPTSTAPSPAQRDPIAHQPASGAAPARTLHARYRRVIIGVAILLVAAVLAVLGARTFVFDTDAGRDFISRYPGTAVQPDWVVRGVPAWLAWQHGLNALFLVLVIRTGWMVHSNRRPSASWSRRAPKPGSTKIAIELWTHLALDLLWLTNGVVFYVLLFTTGQWARIVPTSWTVLPNAASAGLQYLSLHWPTEDGWVSYNSLQLMAYGATVFIAAPLAIVSGFRMSPLWPSRNLRLSNAYPVAVARALHLPVMLYFVAFVIVHVGLVLSTGALRNLNHMYGGQDDVNWWGAGIFAISLLVTIGGWLLLRPAIMQQAGAVFGKVGR